ncbi:MAG: Ig-like domain-containing protein [Bacteroidia bacterium]|nr:Ig-like domain-containing protein [Bacteroidia bacterium]
MKSIFLSLYVVVMTMSLNAQTVNQRFFLDFGPNDVTNGNITVSPDVNGNYWTNVTGYALNSNVTLVNTANTTSNYVLTTTVACSKNGILNGALLTPDPALLGEMAVNTATQDYFFNGVAASFKISGLNPSKGYKFHAFGSRSSATEVRTTQYVFTGVNSFTGTNQTSGPGLGGATMNQNTQTFLTSTIISPTASGVITIDVSKAAGTYWHLNMMKIEEFNASPLESITVTSKSVSAAEGTYRMTATILPINAIKEVTWSLDNTEIATIDGTGLLKAKKDGTITVTATTKDPTSTVKGSLQLSVIGAKIAVIQSLFLDFGTSAALTISPDANGNYWNNITDPTATALAVPLVNSLSTTTGYSQKMITSLSAYDVTAGGLAAPDPLLLGEFAIATATQDYFGNSTTGSMSFAGLNPNSVYKFKIFGSRNTTETRIAQYDLVGLNTSSGTLQTGGVNLGGPGYNGNTSTVYSSGFVVPNASNEISLKITKLQGSNNNINILKIEEYDHTPIDSITIASQAVSGTLGAYQMTATVSPSNTLFQDVTWSVDNQAIATIDNTGILKAKTTGTVTVTATTKDPSSTKSGNLQMNVSIENVTSITVTSALVNNSSNTLQMTADVLPSTATFKGVKWSIDNPVVASIDSTGFIIVKANGTLKVTATTTQPNAAISGTCQIVTIVDDALLNKSKISVMGSSVPSGAGATTVVQGYVGLYTKLLQDRYANSTGSSWNVANISVGGDNTLKVMARWNTDLIPQYSKYVMYALSLGNEGILGGGQPKFDQFKTNMLLLIDNARKKGMYPMVTNCYTRADFTAVEYEFIKQMNLLIHEWDVPSVNLLGAIDDGAGKWPVGYQFDTAHPNDAGHIELSMAVVPSLYDAIKAGKPLPVKATGTYLKMGKSLANQNQIALTPENTIHPFTISFDVKTTDTGTIASFKQGTALGTVSINASGMLCYQSPNGGSLTGQVAVNDGQWHKITLTHFYARGETILYVDTIAIGNSSEKLQALSFYLSDKDAPNAVEFRELFFYRAGMNAYEVAALNAGKMLKSSLEIYAPLDGQKILSNDILVNLAQSTNTIKLNEIPTKVTGISDLNAVSASPNPVIDKLIISGISPSQNSLGTIYGVYGRVVLSNIIMNNNYLNVASLQAGWYILSLKNNDSNKNVRLNFIKK